MSFIEELNYCHDGLLREVSYVPSREKDKRLTLLIECAADTGSSAWDGVTIRVHMDDVLLLRHIAWGHTAGDESVDGFHAGVSADLVEELEQLRRGGIRVPAAALTVTFHSGSVMEVVCARVRVERTDRTT